MGEVFERLARSAVQRTAVLEMPVALIERSYWPIEPTLVTLWKKPRKGEKLISLSEFLAGRAPIELKKKACLGAARQVAKLHAAGLMHGHLHSTNIIIDEKGNARLIDPTIIQEIQNEEWRRHERSRIPSLSLATRDFVHPQFENQVLAEYDRQYAKSRSKR